MNIHYSITDRKSQKSVASEPPASEVASTYDPLLPVSTTERQQQRVDRMMMMMIVMLLLAATANL